MNLEALQRHHVVIAIHEVDLHGVPERRDSRDYDLLFQNRKYPPKYVVYLAVMVATGEDWSPEIGDSTVARRHLKRLGFKIVPKGVSPKH
jgi:5-methylcytosine-specific restriction enzyme B